MQFNGLNPPASKAIHFCPEDQHIIPSPTIHTANSSSLYTFQCKPWNQNETIVQDGTSCQHADPEGKGGEGIKTNWSRRKEEGEGGKGTRCFHWSSETNLSWDAQLKILIVFFFLQASQKGMSETLSGLVFSFYALVMFVSSPLFGKIVSDVKATWNLITYICRNTELQL